MAYHWCQDLLFYRFPPECIHDHQRQQEHRHHHGNHPEADSAAEPDLEPVGAPLSHTNKHTVQACCVPPDLSDGH